MRFPHEAAPRHRLPSYRLRVVFTGGRVRRRAVLSKSCSTWGLVAGAGVVGLLPPKHPPMATATSPATIAIHCAFIGLPCSKGPPSIHFHRVVVLDDAVDNAIRLQIAHRDECPH